MRLIHTADWHLGRSLRGKDRTPELEFALDRLLDSAIDLQVDAVLIAGDIFDSANPSAYAEQVAYRFFHRLNQAGIPAVAIAGNHDSAARIDSVAQLLSLAGVRILGRPRTAANGGVISLDTASGRLVVGAMPFASERRLLSARDLWDKSDVEQVLHYRDRISYLLQNLARGFTDTSVNLLMAHLTIGSATLSNSERRFDSIYNYALSGQILPPEAQYIALGHIHKPQAIENMPVPTRYSGSLIQVDFGEVNEDKGFNLITVEPGSPARVEFVSLPLHTPLVQVECGVDRLEEALEPYRDRPGHLKVIVRLPKPQLGLADRVRRICPHTLHVEPRYPQAPQAPEPAPAEQLDPVSQFQRYYQEKAGSAPTAAVVSAFQKLYEDVQNATA